MKNNLLLLCLMILVGSMTFVLKAQTQTLTYKIYQGKHCLGSLIVKKTTQDTVVYYSYVMHVKFKVLLNFELNQTIQETFHKGKLQKSVCVRTLDGKVKVNNLIQRKGSVYHFSGEGEKSSIYKGDILTSMITLYFSTPGSNTNSLAQSYLEMVAAQKVKSDSYIFTCSNGNVTTYSYANGVCSTLEAAGTWGGTIRCVLFNNTKQ